ncbi:lysozyme inhibitor LprI family protein [Rhizobium leguminosarum]|uniref:lysozyme inhibitor LprI family protein n=1 Tax=Rhizobium leguminosarum TaxID=384 RepID=UPI003F9BD3D7
MKSLTPQEIIDRKRRQGKPRKATELVMQINDLRAAWARRPNDDRYLADLIIVRLVTVLEVFTRLIVAEMVDSDAPDFSERARNLVKDRKLDFLFADSISKEDLTIGDIVGHAISVSSLDSLLGALRALVPDLEMELLAAHSRWTEDLDRFPLDPIIKDYEKTKIALKRLFEIRHVMVHEIPAEKPFEDDDIEVFCEAVSNFVSGCDWMTVKLIEDTIPFTQTQMTHNAAASVAEAEEELKEILAQAATVGGIDASTLDRSQEAWRTFAENDAVLYAHVADGGTLYPVLYAGRLEELIRYRIDDLVEFIEERHKA